MNWGRSAGRTTEAVLGALALAVLAFSVSHAAGPASGPSCARFAVHELSPGMSYDQVRQKMGGEGLKSLARTLSGRETSVASYRGRAFDVYVEYDHRIDRRPAARVALVRASIPLLPADAEALVQLFGVPDVGAADLAGGLHDGIAVWVDEPCGVVLTAYRVPASWWAAEGGTTLQLETLGLALNGESPGSSSVRAILERKKGSPAAIAMDMNANGVDQASSMAPDVPAESEPPPVIEPDAVETDDSLPDEASSVATDPAPVSERPLPVMEEPVADVEASAAALVTSPSPAPPELESVAPVSTAPPTAPHTIATWRARPADPAPTTTPKSSAPSPAKSIATWQPRAPAPAKSDAARHEEVLAATTPDRPAERIAFVPPVYPANARRMRRTGRVTLAIVVEADGTVASPRVMAVDPPNRGFAGAAIDAVQKWRYNPAIHEGKPVASNLTVDFEFK